MPEDGIEYGSFTVISIDFLLVYEKKYYLQVYLDNFAYKRNGIKVRVFFGRKHRKKYLCRHDKNCFYFWNSNIPVINLIVGSRNMIQVSINMSL